MQPRVISLIASATEIACALGAKDFLVGRSHECDFPETIRTLPVCSHARVSMHAPSSAIHESVQELIRNALSLYEVDVEKLKHLKPDVILTQDHCRVCAVSLPDVEAALAELYGHDITVVSLHPASLADIWQDITRIGDATGKTSDAIKLVTDLQNRLATIVPSEPEFRPGVVCLEWLDPLMACGNWIPDLITAGGGRELIGKADIHSGIIDAETLLAADPEVIICAPCGFDLSRTLQEISILSQKPHWNSLRAVRNQKVFAVDGNAYMNRPGPRILDSAHIINKILKSDGKDAGDGVTFSRWQQI